MDYASLLADKRWIKKRNIIFKRDDFKCTVCGSNKDLQVHHTYYYKKMMAPWVYPLDSLLTLCGTCHKNWHEYHEIEYRKNPKSKHRKNKQSPKIFNSLAEKLAYRNKERDRRKNSVKIKGKWYKLY